MGDNDKVIPYYTARRNKRRSMGLCLRCNQPLKTNNYCELHAEDHNRIMLNRYYAKKAERDAKKQD